MTPNDLPDDALERLRLQADPLADRTIAAILGPWQAVDGAGATTEDALAANPVAARRLALLNRLIQQWTCNADVTGWQAPAGTPPEVAGPLAEFLARASALPPWADRALIRRAENVFAEHGILSCMLLFCASLPQCYVVPDLALTLHTTGQLEQHTDYRIRATAGMIFPVMMAGGLTRPDGAGLAQVLKVRLIHATIRYLILRGDPLLQADPAAARTAAAPAPAPLAMAAGAAPRVMHEALLAHGWNVERDGLPCNQQEMAYTLLTFHCVFLLGMRKLGLRLGPGQEEAYLHTWNVVGHLVGVEPGLIASTVPEAHALFQRLQAAGRERPVRPDPRPALTAALMKTMEQVIPLRLLKPIPPLLTLFLCGRRSARDIGLVARVGWGARMLFFALLMLVRLVDLLMKLLLRQTRVARFLLRVIGRRVLSDVLMDETRPLALPGTVSGQVQGMALTWQADPRAPGWLNRWEQRLMPRRARAQAAAPLAPSASPPQ